MSTTGGNQKNRIAIYLTEEEIKTFKWLWEYYDIWNKAKGLKPGSLVLHFNNQNKIKKKEFHFYESHKLDTKLLTD